MGSTKLVSALNLLSSHVRKNRINPCFFLTNRLPFTSVAEPQGPETFCRSWYLMFHLRLRLWGPTKVVYFIIIHLQQDEASDLNRYFSKKLWKLHFNWKAVKTGTGTVPIKLKSELEPNFLKVWAGSGAETNSFGSGALPFTNGIIRLVVFKMVTPPPPPMNGHLNHVNYGTAFPETKDSRQGRP